MPYRRSPFAPRRSADFVRQPLAEAVAGFQRREPWMRSSASSPRLAPGMGAALRHAGDDREPRRVAVAGEASSRLRCY